MKKQKEKSEGNLMMLKNTCMVLGAMFRRYPHTRWQVPVYIVCRVGNRFFSSLIPAVTIAAVTSGSVKKFIWMILALLVGSSLLQWIDCVLRMDIKDRRTYTRLGDFFYRFLEKNLTTDYANIEPQEQQKNIQKGSTAISGGGTGPEQLMRNSVDFVVQLTGLVTYASTILVLDVRILLVLLGMFVMDVLLRHHAISYAYKHREESTEAYRKRDYLKRNSLDINAGKDVRIYRMERWFHEMFEDVIRRVRNFNVKTEFHWYFPVISDQIFISARDLISYFVLIGMVLAGEIDVASFTLLLGMISGFSSWIWFLSDAYSRMKQASWEVTDYRAVMEMKDSFLHEAGEAVPDSQSALKIEFRDVSFRYDGAEGDTLSHVSFVMEAGEKLALVGHNGAGKTTLVKLLCGLYQPTGGKILVNDRDISKMQLEEYHRLISVLFQDVAPMAFSIEQNVAGCVEEEIDPERLKSSLQRAGLWEKVSGLTQGTKTCITQELDEGGIQFSGGETQKLLLARAIYKDAPLLVLDEPSSALDPIAESKMYEEYSNMTDGKTSLFISHRLASTKFCDRILLLEQGKILEQGSHDALMEQQGRYRELYDIQSHYYQEEVTDGEA